MSVDSSDELIASWKRDADQILMGDGPFRRACEQKDERGISFHVRIVTAAEEHELRSWEPKLRSFLLGYGFDVQLEEVTISAFSETYLDEVDLFIILPLSNDVESFCLELAKDQIRASRMIVCVPEDDDGKMYCRLIRERYGVETVTLPRQKMLEGRPCRFGLDLIRHCANYMMKKVAAGIRQLHLQNTIVVLIHGIRTRALWQGEVRRTLEKAGLVAIPTNYKKFDVLRFLLPFKWTKKTPIRKVEEDVRSVRRKFPGANISVLSHSFGTFIMGQLLVNPEHRFDRIALCGSVLRSDFDFASAEGRFSDVINEVGCRDIWPAVAAKIGWGYDPTGSFGFNRGSFVQDRKHALHGHSGFLNGAFCDKFWVPYFCDGCKDNVGDVTAQPSLWVRVVDNVPLAKVAFWGVLLPLVCWVIGTAGAIWLSHVLHT